MSTKANSRDRRRLLQSGGIPAPKSAAKSARDRSQLPGFDQHPELVQVARTPGSLVKKQNSKLNTPTKTRDTPAAEDHLAAWDDPATGVFADREAAGADPYEFPADDTVDAQDVAAAAAVNPARLPQQPRQPTAKQRLSGLSHFPPQNHVAEFMSAGGISGARRVKKTLRKASRQLDFESGLAAEGFNVGVDSSGMPMATPSDVPIPAAPGYSKQWLANATGVRRKQTGIRNFAVPQALLSPQPSGLLPAGMVNHGNTCYLNAVLQALLSLKCLGDDLSGSRLQQLHLSSDGVTHALQTCLQQHTALGSSGGSDGPFGSSAISPAAVSAAMARLDSRWGLCRQEDAHEFLTALLEALQTEVLAAQAILLKKQNVQLPALDSAGTTTADHQQVAEQPTADAVVQNPPSTSNSSVQLEQSEPDAAVDDAGPCPGVAERTVPCLGVSAAADPASRNFSGCLQHTLTCGGCGHVTIVKEQFNHLSLDLPAPGSTSQQQQQQSPSQDQTSISGVVNLLGNVNSPEPIVPELQSLLANFFTAESLEKSCEACHEPAVQHSLQHAVRRLPRVLVVHLKRFQWQVLPGCGAICRKLSTRVKPDATLSLGGVCCPGRPVPPLIAELMPPGLIERAQQALQQHQQLEDAGGDGDAAVNGKQQRAPAASAATGSKRSRCTDAGHDATATIMANKQQHQQQEKQQNLWTAWGGAGQNKAAGKSRFERMSTVTGQSFHNHNGARHTDLTQFVRHPNQQRKRSYAAAAANSDPILLDDGHDADFENDAEHMGGLKRNNSSTGLASLAHVIQDDDDEDEELQKVLAESMRTHEAEQHRSMQHPAAAADDDNDNDGPPAKTVCLGVDAAANGPQHSAAVLDDVDDDEVLPDWVNQQHAAQTSNATGVGAAAAAGTSVPHTPHSSPQRCCYKQKGGRKVMYANMGSRQPLQPLTDLDGQDNLYDWGADTRAPQQLDECDADDPQAASAAAAGSGGGVGLSGGLAFSDPAVAGGSGGPASVQQQQRQKQSAAGGVFNGLPLLSAAAAAGGDGGGGFMPSSPSCRQPGPVLATTAQGTARNSGSSNDSSGMHVGAEVGVAAMTEEEQLALAMAESMKDHTEQQQQQQQVKPTGTDSISSPVRCLDGIDAENYDYEAALQKALEESAAAAEQQQQQQQVVTGAQEDGAAAPAVFDAAAAAAADGATVHAGDPCSSEGIDDQVANKVAAAAAAIASGDSDDAEDDAVVLVHEAGAAAGAAADQLKQPRPRMQLIRLVEDSDCEDEGSPSAGPQAAQQQPEAAEAMDVEVQEQPAADAPAAPAVAADKAAQAVGKENAEQPVQQGVSSRTKKQRKPLGEILGNRNANLPATAVSATDPPLKQRAVVAAVAASEAAAAAANAAAGSSGLAAAEVAAAAEAVGHWPQENAANYRLWAVVRHKGPLASSGHFVSDVKSNLPEGVWFHYDDSYVQPTRYVNVVRDCQQDGYLFFYVNAATLPVQPPRGASKQQL